MSKPKNSPIIARPSQVVPDPAAVQASVDRHLAHRLGTSLALAGTIAGLAGIGPQFGRDAR